MTTSTNPMLNTTSTGSISSNPPWMFDSGASHHVASTPASFHTLSEYGGPNEIVIGNGTNLSISHIGHSTLPTTSRPLNLHNILFVPKLRSNLISVAKLCKSNQVSVEFFPYFFLVKDLHKDLHTGTILMRGVNINDIYYATICSLEQLPRTNSTVTFQQSTSSWHHKLGHPSLKIFKFLLGRFGSSCNHFTVLHVLSIKVTNCLLDPTLLQHLNHYSLSTEMCGDLFNFPMIIMLIM